MQQNGLFGTLQFRLKRSFPHQRNNHENEIVRCRRITAPVTAHNFFSPPKFQARSQMQCHEGMHLLYQGILICQP